MNIHVEGPNNPCYLLFGDNLEKDKVRINQLVIDPACLWRAGALHGDNSGI